MIRLLLLVATITSCTSGDTPAPEGQHVRTGLVGYDAPKGWAKTGTHTHTSETTTWSPSPDNPGKESISIIWTKVLPFPAADDLDKLLAQGEVGLPGVHLGKPYRVESAGGMSGFQIESDYEPFGDDHAYHRVHAVLVDGDALVHVLYVARDPDESRATLRMVMNSMRNEEG